MVEMAEERGQADTGHLSVCLPSLTHLYLDETAASFSGAHQETEIQGLKQG